MTTLQEWRLLRNLTQAELAEMVGVHPATIGRAETGSPIRREFFQSLCDELKITPGDVTEVVLTKRVYHRKKKNSAAIE